MSTHVGQAPGNFVNLVAFPRVWADRSKGVRFFRIPRQTPRSKIFVVPHSTSMVVTDVHCFAEGGSPNTFQRFEIMVTNPQNVNDLNFPQSFNTDSFAFETHVTLDGQGNGKSQISMTAGFEVPSGMSLFGWVTNHTSATPSQQTHTAGSYLVRIYGYLVS